MPQPPMFPETGRSSSMPEAASCFDLWDVARQQFHEDGYVQIMQNSACLLSVLHERWPDGRGGYRRYFREDELPILRQLFSAWERKLVADAAAAKALAAAEDAKEELAAFHQRPDVSPSAPSVG